MYDKSIFHQVLDMLEFFIDWLISVFGLREKSQGTVQKVKDLTEYATFEQQELWLKSHGIIRPEFPELVIKLPHDIRPREKSILIAYWDNPNNPYWQMPSRGKINDHTVIGPRQSLSFTVDNSGNFFTGYLHLGHTDMSQKEALEFWRIKEDIKARTKLKDAWHRYVVSVTDMYFINKEQSAYIRKTTYPSPPTLHDLRYAYV